MSCYDDIFFKSKHEDSSKWITILILILYKTHLDKITLKKDVKEYNKQFIEKYEGLSKDEIKLLASIEKKDQELFDYFYLEKSVNADFFTNTRIFDDKMSQNDKIDFLLNYLELKYKLITPSSIKHMFKELGMGTDLPSNEYSDLMITIFGKENLNLKFWRDRELMKNFFKGKENIHEIEEQNNKENLDNLFPDVSNKPKIKIAENTNSNSNNNVKEKSQMVILN